MTDSTNIQRHKEEARELLVYALQAFDADYFHTACLATSDASLHLRVIADDQRQQQRAQAASKEPSL